MKITHQDNEGYIQYADLPIGSFSVTRDGHYYYRASDKILECLDNPGCTYATGVTTHIDKVARVLPKGTKITIEI